MDYKTLKKVIHQINWHDFYNYLKVEKELNNPRYLNELIYIRGYQDFEFFARYFFPHHCKYPLSAMHLDFCLAEVEPGKRGRREAIAAPRANAKTTYKLLIKAIHAIVYEYESFILVIGHSATESEEKVRSILEELECNQFLINIFGNLAPRQGRYDGPARWGKKKFVTQNGIMVMAKSRGQQVRGIKHGADRPSLIICDDIEAPGEVLSPEQRQKTRDWFYKDVLKCGQLDGSTNITVIGTCLHPESLLSELLYSPGFNSRLYQSVLSYATHQELWQTWQDIYTNLSDSNRKADATAFFENNKEAMLMGTQVLWPEGESYEYLMRIRIEEGVASFQSEKQNEPFDPERQIFDMTKAKKFRLLYDGKAFSRLQWLDGSEKMVSSSELKRIIAFHDPALGKKPGQHSEPDYAAIVVVAEDMDGYHYCLDAYIEKSSPTKQIEKTFELYDKWCFERLYLEDNHFQDLMKPLYAQANEGRSGKQMFVQGVHQHENKQKRISTLEPEITNGYLLFAESLTPQLIDQLTLFPTTYDDGPDALQGAISQLKKNQLYIGLV